MNRILKGVVSLVLLAALSACASANVAPVAESEFATIPENSVVILLGVADRGRLRLTAVNDTEGSLYEIPTTQEIDVFAYRYPHPVPGKLRFDRAGFGYAGGQFGILERTSELAIDKPGVYYYMSLMTLDDNSFTYTDKLPDEILARARVKYAELFKRLKPVNFKN